jgi:hypothetical protein
MDFIVELPESDRYDMIYVCVDRLTKMAHFIPTTTTVNSKQLTAKLYYCHMFTNHSLPYDIVSDRGPQFVSQFTCHLLEKLEIQGNQSTSHRLQSGGQMERVNQTLEQYLWVYCDYQQNNWHELLPLAELIYNNSQNASTPMSPFFTNYGYHPQILHIALSNPPRSLKAATTTFPLGRNSDEYWQNSGITDSHRSIRHSDSSKRLENILFYVDLQRLIPSSAILSSSSNAVMVPLIAETSWLLPGGIYVGLQ